MVVHRALQQKVFRTGPEEKATREGGLNQALGFYAEDRREELFDLKAVLWHLKCPAVKGHRSSSPKSCFLKAFQT